MLEMGTGVIRAWLKDPLRVAEITQGEGTRGKRGEDADTVQAKPIHKGWVKEEPSKRSEGEEVTCNKRRHVGVMS